MTKFTHALTRPPGANFAAGLTSAAAGPPNLDLALRQHAAYCDALRRCKVAVTALAPEPDHPDATFVEDTAVLAERTAIVTRPGAPSRLGETAAVAAALRALRGDIHEIRAPGTLDGGDVCQAESHFFVGLSARTNAAGARQFRAIVEAAGYTMSTIDIRGNRRLLHLKSGIAYLGDRRLLVVPDLPGAAEFAGFESIEVCAAESYAANCVRVNEHVLIAAGYPRTAAALRACGYSPLPIDVSEFRKMDGGLSCLSLRYEGSDLPWRE